MSLARRRSVPETAPYGVDRRGIVARDTNRCQDHLVVSEVLLLRLKENFALETRMNKVTMLVFSLLYSSSCFSSLFELETAIITSYGKNELGIDFLEDRKGKYQKIVLPSSRVALCKSDGSTSPQDGFAFMAGPTRADLVIVLILNKPESEVIGIHGIKLEENSDSPFDLVFSDDDIARMAGSKEADLKFKQYWGKKVLDCVRRFYKDKK